MHTTTDTCAGCGAAMILSREPIPFALRGEKVMVPDIEHLTCCECGEMLFDLGGAARVQRAAVDQLRATRGLLTSTEIRDLRLSLGLSQAAFEHLLGIGPKTVVRWEKGTVFQSATADRLMRLVREMPDALDVLRSTAPVSTVAGHRGL